MSVKKAHQITTALKKDIASTLFESEVAMHIEPCDKDCAYAKNNDQCPYTDSD